MNNPIRKFIEGEIAPKNLLTLHEALLRESPLQPRDKVQHISGGPEMVIIDIRVDEKKDYKTNEIRLTLSIHCQYFNKNRQQFDSGWFSINALNKIEDERNNN